MRYAYSMSTSPAVLAVLDFHGLSLDAALADNVAFVCLDCESISSVTPAPGQTREEQRDLLREDLDMSCCGVEMEVI